MLNHIPDKIILGVFEAFKQMGEVIEDEEKEYISKQLESIHILVVSLIDKVTHSKNTPVQIVEFGCGLNSLMWAVVESIATNLQKNINYVGIDIDKEAIKKRAQLLDTLKNPYCKSNFIAADASDAKNWISAVGNSPSDAAIFMNPLVEDPFAAASDYSYNFSQASKEQQLDNLEEFYQNFIHLSQDEHKMLNFDKNELELLLTPTNQLKSLNTEQVNILNSIDKKFQQMRLQKLNYQYEQFKTIFNKILPNYFAKDSLLLVLTFYETEFVALHRLLGIAVPEKKSESDVPCLAVTLNKTKLFDNLNTESKAKPNLFSVSESHSEDASAKQDSDDTPKP